jgi:hypothetical protein
MVAAGIVPKSRCAQRGWRSNRRSGAVEGAGLSTMPTASAAASCRLMLLRMEVDQGPKGEATLTVSPECSCCANVSAIQPGPLRGGDQCAPQLQL